MSKGKGKGVSFDGGPVGYKRPPVETQFKPGQKRPNAGGRRREKKSLEAMIEDIARQKVFVTENGKRKKVELVEALVKKARALALGSANFRDIKQFLDLLDRLAPRLVKPELQPLEIRMIPGDEGL